jgi:subtilisin family serine protease
MKERIMSRAILVAAAITALAGAAEAAQFNTNFNVGPRSGPSISNIGPRGPNFDRPRFNRDPGATQTNPNGPDPSKTTSTGQPRKVKKNTGGNTGGNTNANAGGLPPTGENRFVPDEVLIAMNGNPEPMARRHNLVRMERLDLGLTGQTLYRWQIPDGRSVRQVIQALANSGVFSQPNYNYQGSQATVASAPAASNQGDPGQYALAKLQVPRAHEIAKGDRVLVAVIDSGIDTAHPELSGIVAETYDAVAGDKPHAHGTGIAGAIASHSRLQGVAPAARVLGVRAFNPSGGGAEGTTFNILKGLNWAAGKGARIFNMSFAGPSDPLLARTLAAARQRGIVLIAASGNAGEKSPPLYPAADPNVIAVSATDADDRLFEASNRGNHVAISAPGVDILLPAPEGSYQVTSGTSFAAAHVSGIAALILERRPDLKPDAVRNILLGGAKDLGTKGRDPQFGAGLADAYQSLMLLNAAASAAASR